MPCHRANNVIYMEEAKGDASEATLGVNATDMQDPARVALFRRRYTPGMDAGQQWPIRILTGNLTVTAKATQVG
jgi:hypothetical protein